MAELGLLVADVQANSKRKYKNILGTNTKTRRSNRDLEERFRRALPEEP